MPYNLISTTSQDLMVNGFKQIEHVRVYETETPNTLTGDASVLNGCPVQIGSQFDFSGTPIFCYDRSAQRRDEKEGRLVWRVTCKLTNDTSKFLRDDNGQPVDDPVNAAPTVDISFFESTEPITKLKFLGCFDQSDQSFSTNTSLNVGQVSPFVNSAGDPFVRERRKWDKAITYWKYFDSYDNSWESIIGKTNQDTVTITQSDGNATRLQQEFAARELLLVDIIKQDTWMQGRMYLRIGFMMLKAKDKWKVREQDRGTRWQIFDGQYKKDGTTYSAADVSAITDADYYMQEIPTYDDTGTQNGLVGDPVPLNGWGAPVPHKRTGGVSTNNKSFYLEWLEYDETSYSALGLS